jgi:hypothetical protein
MRLALSFAPPWLISAVICMDPWLTCPETVRDDERGHSARFGTASISPELNFSRAHQLQRHLN